MIAPDMFLDGADVIQCRRAANNIAKNVAALPGMLHGQSIGLNNHPNPNFQADVRVVFERTSSVATPLDIRGKTASGASVALVGVAASSDGVHWTTRLSGSGAHLAEALVGVIAHELVHALTHRSAAFNHAAWDSAIWLGQQAAALGASPLAYQSYILHPYELHAHATQIVAMLVDTHTKRALVANPAQFEQLFVSSMVAGQVAAHHGQPPARGLDLVHALWTTAPSILAAM